MFSNEIVLFAVLLPVVFVLFLPVILIVLLMRPAPPRSIAVVVLGDAEHSPRTMAHVGSLLRAKYAVHLFAYNRLPGALARHAQAGSLRFTALPGAGGRAAGAAGSWLYLPVAAVAAVRRAWALFRALVLCCPPCRAVLIQNPPCVPAFLVAFLGRVFRGWAVVADWHNLSWTIMRSAGVADVPVALAWSYECFCGRLMDAHLCVSEGLRKWLAENLGVVATVVFDRPIGEWRERVDREERRAFMRRIEGLCGEGESQSKRNAEVKLVVTSTSWTPDEDFGILLEALKKFDQYLKARGNSRLRVIITGRGPLKSEFEKSLKQADLERVRVGFAWLEYEDYLKLLSVADLGISLHVSSSGLDLPMKVVDMFGCGLPVMSYRYERITELVRDGVNGYLFDDEASLAEGLVKLLGGEGTELKRMRKNIERFFSQSSARWEKYWEIRALPVFEKLCT